MNFLISVPDQLAPQLRSLRKARGLTQAELASKLGVSQSRIAAIERNAAAVSSGQLLSLLKVLGVDLLLRDTQAQTASAAASSQSSRTATQPPMHTPAQGQW
jgi:HTH-type transcriptional regulator / antitoxin HipB